MKKWIAKLLKSYDPQTDEARLLREYDKALDGILDSISEIWDETLSRSGEVNQAIEKSKAAKNKKVPVTERFNIPLKNIASTRRKIGKTVRP